MDEPYKEICRGYIEDIFKGAKEVFGDGIYVKSNSHPCGWDFISFEDFKCVDDMFEQTIDNDSISNGCYHWHNYEDKTVAEILNLVGMKGWCFEISGVDNFE